MSLEEAVESIPPGEFWKRLLVLEEEIVERRPEHYYLANIAYRIYLLQFVVGHMFDPNPPQPEKGFKDFLLDFATDDDPEVPEGTEETGEERKERIARSRAVWLAAAGIDKDGKVKRQKPPTAAKRRAMQAKAAEAVTASKRGT